MLPIAKARGFLLHQRMLNIPKDVETYAFSTGFLGSSQGSRMPYGTKSYLDFYFINLLGFIPRRFLNIFRAKGLVFLSAKTRYIPETSLGAGFIVLSSIQSFS